VVGATVKSQQSGQAKLRINGGQSLAEVSDWLI